MLIKLITCLFSQDADPIYDYSAYWQYHPFTALKQKGTSCLRQIHSWLHTTINDDIPGNLGVLAMQGFNLPLNVDKICKGFVTKHNRKLCTSYNYFI